MKVEIKNFNDIDFLEIDPERDEFHLENGEIYVFTSEVCHNCWGGGTVVKEISKNVLYCIRCESKLRWVSIDVKLGNETSPAAEDFLLPSDWSQKNIDTWLTEFKIRRDQELAARNNMLHTSEGGEYL